MRQLGIAGAQCFARGPLGDRMSWQPSSERRDMAYWHAQALLAAYIIRQRLYGNRDDTSTTDLVKTVWSP